MSKKEEKEFHWVKLRPPEEEYSEDFLALLERAWNDGAFMFALVTHPTDTMQNEVYKISDAELEGIKRFAMKVREFAGEKLEELGEEMAKLPGEQPGRWINCSKMESLGIPKD